VLAAARAGAAARLVHGLDETRQAVPRPGSGARA